MCSIHMPANSQAYVEPRSAQSVPVLPSRSTLRPLGFDEVELTGGFWGERQQINSSATLSHIEEWQEREGWLANFDRIAFGNPSGRRGREFSDSEVYKLLEAMAWETGREANADLSRRIDALAARVAAAQDDDGYISTKFGHAGQAERYSDLEWGHELYCQGHLLQAAVALIRTGRPDHQLVSVARRSADHICRAFGASGIQSVCGHPEIEVALAEFSRATGELRYLEQARLFLERRGTHVLDDIEWGRSYFQDDLPIRDADVFRGHAVRASYLAAGAVDAAVDLGDAKLLAAIEQQWRNTAARRTYITGGQGSRHQDEGFGDDFSLPPDRAYSETCAAIAWNMVSWRLLLETADPRYSDAMERALFNVVATSSSDDGRAFYYANTLHQRVASEAPPQDEASKRALSSLRAPWFEVTCCPPNVARTLASLDQSIATADRDGVQIHQYAPAVVDTELTEGRSVRLRITTDYPASGQVNVTVEAAPRDGWRLSMRVPSWCLNGADLTIPGQGTRRVEPGMVSLHGLEAGSTVTLDLDMTPQFVRADPRVDAVRGCVAVQRGPEVWCVESVDIPSEVAPVNVDRIAIDTTVPLRFENGRIIARAYLRAPYDDTTWPYTSDSSSGGDVAEVIDLPLTPYHRWARRGPSTMRVWIPESAGHSLGRH